MLPRIMTSLLLVVPVLLVSNCAQTTAQATALTITPVASAASQPAPTSADLAFLDDLVKTIVLPHNEPSFPQGPGWDTFVTSCALCHSPRYISMQPDLPRATWTAVVTKMVKTFGAPMNEQQVGQVVDYLVFYQGSKTAANRH